MQAARQPWYAQCDAFAGFTKENREKLSKNTVRRPR